MNDGISEEVGFVLLGTQKSTLSRMVLVERDINSGNGRVMTPPTTSCSHGATTVKRARSVVPYLASS